LITVLRRAAPRRAEVATVISTKITVLAARRATPWSGDTVTLVEDGDRRVVWPFTRAAQMRG
jgi:hypothetical protein